MKLFFADEADQKAANRSKFFIFGAVIVDYSVVSKLTEGISKIRKKYGYLPTDSFKFSPSDRPVHISIESFILAKKETLILADKLGVVFIGYCILHDLAKHVEYNTLIEWGADAILTKFQQYLTEIDSHGLCFFDRLPTKNYYKYLRKKFETRETQDKAGLNLTRILSFSSVCDGSSHLSSLSDIAVGSFRYIINEPDKEKAGKELARLLKPIFWAKQTETKRSISERGLLMRPTNVRVSDYFDQYNEAKIRLIEWANSKP